LIVNSERLTRLTDRLLKAQKDVARAVNLLRETPSVMARFEHTGMLPADLYIPGRPLHPLTILDGLLRLLGKI
jgi:Ni,Fe-hydrogenase III small subunit